MILPDLVIGVFERMSRCSPLGFVDEEEDMVVVPIITKVQILLKFLPLDAILNAYENT